MEPIPVHNYDYMSTAILHMKVILSKFASLIEKDGGIRPCEVLATCAYKVPTFYPALWER